MPGFVGRRRGYQEDVFRLTKSQAFEIRHSRGGYEIGADPDGGRAACGDWKLDTAACAEYTD